MHAFEQGSELRIVLGRDSAADLLTKHLISAAKAEELLGKLWHTYRGRTRSSGPQATRRWQAPGALAVESEEVLGGPRRS